MSEQVTDLSVESIAVAVTQTVSDTESCNLLELPPLYDAVDIGALEAFCAHTSPVSDDEPPEGSVSFTYSESLVSLDRGEAVTVEAVPATDEAVSEAFMGVSASLDASSHSDD